LTQTYKVPEIHRKENLRIAIVILTHYLLGREAAHFTIDLHPLVTVFDHRRCTNSS